MIVFFERQTGSNILYTSFLELQKLLALYFSADSPPPTGSGPSEHTQQFQPQSSVFFISPLSLFRPHGAGTSSSFAPSQQSSQTSHPHTSVELMTRSCHEKKTEWYMSIYAYTVPWLVASILRGPQKPPQNAFFKSGLRGHLWCETRAER